MFVEIELARQGSSRLPTVFDEVLDRAFGHGQVQASLLLGIKPNFDEALGVSGQQRLQGILPFARGLQDAPREIA